jgi:YbbR domain-containing protein
MTRALAFLIHNWPLKLAAVVLASLLYGVFVVTQNTRTLNDLRIPITEELRPEGVQVLSSLGSVTQVTYFSQDPNVRVTGETFTARADLSAMDTARPSNVVDIEVTSIDPRVEVIDWQPPSIVVQSERIEQRSVPVRVERREDPLGFDIRAPEITPDQVIVEGPASLVRRVDAAVAFVQIDPSGLDFDRDVELIPIDALDEELRGVDVEPSSAHIRIAVFTNGQQRSVPVKPNIIGTPAPGFEIASVTVDPLVVAVEGDADQLATLIQLDTEAISVNAASERLDRTALLVLPTGILPVDVEEVRVTITLRQVSGSRNFSAGLRLEGARSDRLYDLSVNRVLVTVGGSVAALDQLEGATFEAHVDVASLEPGSHDVPVVVNLPAGLALVSASPPVVTVVVTVPAVPSGSPVASAAP